MEQGNELIDPALALGYELPEVVTSHDERDVALYALGVGAGSRPDASSDLPFVYEGNPEGFRVLPTFAVVPAVNAILELMKQGKQAPGLRYGLDRTLHGEQLTEILAPFPTRGRLTHRSRIKNLFDKGKNALVVTEVRTFDEGGVLIARNEVTTFVRGAGGFGGSRGTQVEVPPPPERAADAVTVERIADNQAMLYRLSGDWNPLHVDPAFATKFGLPRPILHGLCTFGFAGRHVLNAFCDGDPSRLRSVRARFAGSVYPGETLKTEMWRTDLEVVFRCSVVEADKDRVVLSNASAEVMAAVSDTKRGAGGAAAA